MKITCLNFAALFCMTTGTAAAQGIPSVIARSDFIAMSRQCAPSVAPETMAAIVKTESDFRPFAIGVNNGASLGTQPKTKEEAVQKAKELIANRYNVDLGLAQISSFNLSVVRLSVEDAFDPCKNLAAAAWILENNYLAAKKQTKDEQSALRAALSAYNTGSFSKGFGNGYVRKVRKNAIVNNRMKMVQVGTSQQEASALGQKTMVRLAETDETSEPNVNIYARRGHPLIFDRENVNVFRIKNQSVTVYTRQ
jgi:type IV secretion system protein VirB1